MDKHEKVLDLLSVMAEGVDRNTTTSGARLAAAIVYKNQVISIGVNQKKSHPFQAKYSTNEDAIFLHAETDTIRTALRHLTEKQLSKATLYVCRIKHEDGPNTPLIWGLAKPCVGCQRAIATFDIKGVVYSEEGTGAYSFL
jgi:deoxycytidylate deaminase